MGGSMRTRRGWQVWGGVRGWGEAMGRHCSVTSSPQTQGRGIRYRSDGQRGRRRTLTVRYTFLRGWGGGERGGADEGGSALRAGHLGRVWGSIRWRTSSAAGLQGAPRWHGSVSCLPPSPVTRPATITLVMDCPVSLVDDLIQG